MCVISNKNTILKTQKVDLRRDRTCNLMIRSHAPCYNNILATHVSTSENGLAYPLGQQANHFKSLIY